MLIARKEQNMNELILLIAMLFFHLLDDYKLQGMLIDFLNRSLGGKRITLISYIKMII